MVVQKGLNPSHKVERMDEITEAFNDDSYACGIFQRLKLKEGVICIYSVSSQIDHHSPSEVRSVATVLSSPRISKVFIISKKGIIELLPS